MNPLSKKNKDRKQSISEPVAIRQHHDRQQGECYSPKEVKHGDRVDQVRDGHLHRIHDKRVDVKESDRSKTTENKI